MRLQIKESTHELTILEKQNPHIGKRFRFIRSLKAAPFTNLGTTVLNTGVNANDARQWLQLYVIGGVDLLMNASIKDPSITGMPLSYSTLSRYVPAGRLNRSSAFLNAGFGALAGVGAKPRTDVQVDNISVFKGTFPTTAGANSGLSVENANGTTSVQAFGFFLSVDYTITQDDMPLAGVSIEEDVKVDQEQIVYKGSQRTTQKISRGFKGPISNKTTDKDGKITDAPLGISSDTPITSATITQALYSVDVKGVKQELVTNKIEATIDYKIVNNKATGSGKINITFSNSTTKKTLTLSGPTKFK